MMDYNYCLSSVEDINVTESVTNPVSSTSDINERELKSEVENRYYYGAKENHANNDYVDDKVLVTETTCNMSHTLSDNVKCDEIGQSAPSSGSLMETGLSTSEARSDRSNENVKIEKVEAGALPDIKIEYDNGLLFCTHCQAYYEDYCITCGMLAHVLNEICPSNTDSTSRELPKGILQIVDLLGRFEVYASKPIPKGVKFGPFTGLGTSGCNWKLKGGKFVVSEDKSKLLNWMQHVSPARNNEEQNLLPFQCGSNLYYRSTRQIQNGEELLVYFGREYEDNLDNDVEIDFTPPTEDGTEDVFACTFCCLGFSSRRYLVKHKSTCVNGTNENFSIEELTQCPLCKIYLGEMEYSKYHMTDCRDRIARNCASFTLEEKPKCGICHRRFKTKGSLKAHVERNHTNVKTKVKRSKVRPNPQDDGKQFQCEICDFRTRDKYYLKTHVNGTHLKEFSHECTGCDYKTNKKSHLIKHIKTNHLKEFSHECGMCEYKTNWKGGLRTHIQTKHLKEFSHQCEICDYKTNMKINLETHIKTKHLKEFSYECEICDYKTNDRSNLKMHIKTKHLNEFNYECEICDYKAKWKASLETHVITNHLKEFSHECEICDYKTARKSQLKIHVKTQHLKEFRYECEICDYKTSAKSNLKIHIKTKHLKEFKYECEICDYKTNVKINLETHIKTKHLKEFSYECEICDYKTNIMANIQKHAKARHLKKN